MLVSVTPTVTVEVCLTTTVVPSIDTESTITVRVVGIVTATVTVRAGVVLVLPTASSSLWRTILVVVSVCVVVSVDAKESAVVMVCGPDVRIAG